MQQRDHLREAAPLEHQSYWQDFHDVAAENAKVVEGLKLWPRSTALGGAETPHLMGRRVAAPTLEVCRVFLASSITYCSS